MPVAVGSTSDINRISGHSEDSPILDSRWSAACVTAIVSFLFDWTSFLPMQYIERTWYEQIRERRIEEIIIIIQEKSLLVILIYRCGQTLYSPLPGSSDVLLPYL